MPDTFLLSAGESTFEKSGVVIVCPGGNWQLSTGQLRPAGFFGEERPIPFDLLWKDPSPFSIPVGSLFQAMEAHAGHEEKHTAPMHVIVTVLSSDNSFRRQTGLS